MTIRINMGSLNHPKTVKFFLFDLKLIFLFLIYDHIK